MTKKLKLIVGAIAATAVATAAHADTIAYDASLASGYYNGTGNPNVGFTTDTTDSGIQLGLGVNLRFIGPVLPTSTDNYTVPVGSPKGAATWDFEYSVDFGSGGVFTDSNTVATLTILNTANGHSVSFDPSPATVTDDATDGHGYQNAENLAFSFLATGLGFNPNAVDQYIITLNLARSTGGDLASVTENVNATPLPAALPLFASGLSALGFFSWRRKRKGAALAG